MYESAESLDLLKDITIDPEFESVCPPLTEDEFALLEQNILSDGEVTSPLVVCATLTLPYLTIVSNISNRRLPLRYPFVLKN
ncbi:MAG: hypothetical protein ACI3VY_05890 [Faecousia sp.]